MTTALASLLSGRPVKHTVGMTGEVTLQGRVLPIGGLKQKVLAAHAAGLTDVVIPERNRADLDDVPEEVREVMTFHPVMTVQEVLDVALEPAREPLAGITKQLARHRGWVDSAAVALPLKRLIVLAAGAGAAWYVKQKLSEDGSEQPPGPPQQAQSPARVAAGTPDPPTPPAQPEPEDPPIETTAFQEPEVEPLAPQAPTEEEPPPAAFEDAHQEGWQDEQLGADPKTVDELEIDPATAADADQDVALEEAEELPEPEHDTAVSHPPHRARRTSPAWWTTCWRAAGTTPRTSRSRTQRSSTRTPRRGPDQASS